MWSVTAQETFWKTRRKIDSATLQKVKKVILIGFGFVEVSRFVPSRKAQWAVYYTALVPVRMYLSIWLGHWPQQHPLLFKERSGWGTVDRVWQPVWRVASGEHEQSSRQAPLGVWRPVAVQGRRYQSLLGTCGAFPLRPVGRCEGPTQLKKAHGGNAWPIAANAAIRAHLHPNEVGLSWARHT